MISPLTPADAARAEALFTQSPVTGLRMEVDFRLLRQNPRMPYRFYSAGESAVLQDTGGYVRLCGMPENPAELDAWLSFIGAKSLFSDGWAPALWQQQPLLTLRLSAPPPPPAEGEPVIDTAPSMEEVIALFAENNSVGLPAYDNLYADLCARRNHGFGCVYGIREGGRLVSTAGLFALTPTRAYIGGVETLAAYRARGYASLLVRRLCRNFAGREISLLCGPPLLSFYSRLGFSPLPPCASLSHPPSPAPGKNSNSLF